MVMHASVLDRSRQLKELLAYLRRVGKRGATALEINRDLYLQNVATWVSMLRKNGHPVTAAYDGKSDKGAKVYRYTLDDPPAPQPDMFGAPNPAPAAAMRDGVPLTRTSWAPMPYCGFCDGETAHRDGCRAKV